MKLFDDEQDLNFDDNIDNIQEKYKKLALENRERLKELACIKQTTQYLKEGKTIAETFHRIAMSIPKGWQFPKYTTARIIFDGKIFVSVNFKGTQWVLRQTFDTIDKRVGAIEVFYTREFPNADEGPFLKEERDLIDNLANLLKGWLDGKIACNINKPGYYYDDDIEDDNQKPKRRKLLQLFLNRNNNNRDIYHDLMPFKITEILLVANLYDAYSIESGGRFSEYVLRQYQLLNLTSVPRITGVSDSDEAMEYLLSKHYDMVILMVGIDINSSFKLSLRIKESFPYLPIFALLNNNQNIIELEEKRRRIPVIDKVFVWNGDSSVFFTMIKLIEDNINADNDTRIGLVRVILLVEDNISYYSRYLPLLYNIVMEQTRRIINDVSTDDLYKVLRMRTRPKILLATSYEEAIKIYNRYSEQMLCLISDVEFYRSGKLDENAGLNLVKHIKADKKDLPVVLQSSDKKYSSIANELGVAFIDKKSESLMQDLRTFILHYLGFGNFIFRNYAGEIIATAKSLKEFEVYLNKVPDESIVYHGTRNHFSLWLMARGEIQVARILHPAQIKDFPDANDMRAYVLDILKKFRNEQNEGKVVPFNVADISDSSNIISLAEGNLGGKGRGIAFINTLIYNYDFSQLIKDINIVTPNTAIIGVDEFVKFVQNNNIISRVLNEDNEDAIKSMFLISELSDELNARLYKLLKFIEKPIAVRSSGMFEDSIYQPFAGIFDTYILPNSHPDINVRLQQLKDAIKLVYASVFSKNARGYVEAINFRIEEEMMAIVIQEVVGNKYGDYYYPHISGVAQSYNYYPVSHMQPEDGMAVMAVGLGKYVVEGEKAYRFSPKYPTVMIDSVKDQFKNSQVEFYAVNMKTGLVDFSRGDMAGLDRIDIYDAESHGTLNHCASVYDPDSDRIIPGLTANGPRIINFANILQYNYAPLAKTISLALDIVQEAVGSPVEIEFAVDLNKDENGKVSFYLLQIKPQISSWEGFNIDESIIEDDNLILYTDKGMGNGKIESVYDVIYIDKDNFDNSKTLEMANEIELLNRMMIKENKKYVLIGPGRWGTRDRWIGIPVDWPQISNAKVIVETDLKGFPLDASSGSHFFHNVTSMNIGYLTIKSTEVKHKLMWNILDEQDVVNHIKYFKHVRFKKPLNIMMDGRKRISVISLNND